MSLSSLSSAFVYSFNTDKTCILMLRSSLLTPNKGLKDHVIGSLVMHLKKPLPLVREHLPLQLEHWSKLQIFKGGDMIHATEMVKWTEDNRDRTFVHVHTHYLLTYMHNPHPVPSFSSMKHMSTFMLMILKRNLSLSFKPSMAILNTLLLSTLTLPQPSGHSA